METQTFSWSILLGGIAFFFFGLKSAKQGLELVAGDRLRSAMTKITGNRFMAFTFGIFITLILQSSGATSAMLVSFAETGILSLFQSTAILLGADIGTTFVVVLLSIKEIANIALIIVAIGLLTEILSNRRRTRDVGQIILGFGLIFYGMQLMSASAEPLKSSELAMKVFGYLAGHPGATLVLASILSAALHSAGTIGIAIALAFAGTINIETAIPIVLGANIGTCITAILAGIGSGAEGRRVALSHTMSKVIGVAIVFPFITREAAFIDTVGNLLQSWVPGYTANIAHKIALVHIMFNIGLAIIFLPLLNPLLYLVQKILPQPVGKKKPFGPKYLDKSSLDTPSLAFAQAKREILRIGATAQWLFSDCLKMFSRGEDYRGEVERIQNEDDRIDILEKSVRFYLAEIFTERLSPDQVKTQMALLAIASDLEDIGDTLSREMVHLAMKKGRNCRVFSDDGWQDLKNFQTMVLENFNLMMSMLAQPAEEIALKLERHENHMNEVEQQLRQAHMNRLHLGLKESFETSSIHLDILANLRRINSKITRIARLAMDTK